MQLMAAPTRRSGSPKRKTSRKDCIRVPRKLDTRGERELDQAQPTGEKDRIRSGTTRARMQRG
jgi:hypothetical protein